MTQAEIDSLLRFLREINVPCGIQEAPALISAALSRLIPCLCGGYGEADPRTGAITVRLDLAELSHSPDEIAFLAERLDEMPYIDLPQCVATVRGGQGWITRPEARMSSDYQSRRQFRETGVYREVYRYKGIEHLLLLPTFGLAPDWVGGFGLQRDTGEFSERDREMLRRVQPHIVAALRNAAAWTRLSQAPEGTCTVLVKRDGRLVLAPERALRWLGRYVGPLRGERLPASLLAWMHQVRTSLLELPVAPLRLPGRDGALVLQLVPALGDDEPEVLLLSEEKAAPLPAGGKLTERELEVLNWIAEAKTNEEIAQILGMSVNTVRTHAKNIFAKLGVENRTAAAAWALSHRGKS